MKKSHVLSDLAKFVKQGPRWILVGGFIFASCSAVLAHVELGALRDEMTFISQLRSELLSKRLKNGKKVSQSIVPGSVTVLRNDDGYFVCGRVVKAQDWVIQN